MPEAEDASAYVYEGLWHNWSKAKICAATLTLTPHNGTVLVAILALLVQVAGSQLWRICQVGIHQHRATADFKDPLYWQQQIVLRNTSTDLNACWQLLRIGWAWRHQRLTKSLSRCALLLTWGLVHLVSFAFLGIFVSTLLDAGDEVLSRSPFCGTYNLTYIASAGSFSEGGMPNNVAVESRAFSQTRYQRTQQYVEFCTASPSACNSLPRNQLPWNSSTTDSCPFDPSLCLDGLKSIRFDTGLLSSHDDFGLNSPRRDRVYYRKATTCTVLNDTGHITDWQDLPATADSPAKRVVDAYYGPNRYADRGATYSYSDWTPYYSFDQYSETNPYQINVQNAIGGDTELSVSDFAPIPELQNPDADLTMVFLSFSKFYEAPVDDPWFFAQKAGQYPARNNSEVVNGTIYSRERPVTTAACIEQQQVCVDKTPPDAEEQNCTPLTGLMNMQLGPQGVASLQMTPKQQEIHTRILQSAADSFFFQILQNLAQRDPPILARRSIQGIIGLQLPSTQWQYEASYWHTISMMNMQRAVIEYSTGQFVADTSYVNTTLTPEQQWLCQNQKIRGTGYKSFTFVGLVVVLVLSTSVVVVGLFIEDILACCHRRFNTSIAKQRMWQANEMLEMLRLLCQRGGGGGGRWGYSGNGVPVCSPGEKFNLDDIEGVGLAF